MSSSTVSVYSNTHSVTYVAENILKSLKDIIRQSGLSPGKLGNDWMLFQSAMTTWIDSGHLQTVILEVYHPTTDELIKRWDVEIAYEWTSGDGAFWVDSEQIRHAIQKAGVWPPSAEYRIVFINKTGRPDVAGFSPTTLRSTAGFIKQSLGTTVQHSGLGAGTSYYRKA